MKLPVNKWPCRKLEKLNLTVSEGYHSRNPETSGLLRDQFVKTCRSSIWYEMHTDKKDSDGFWLFLVSGTGKAEQCIKQDCQTQFSLCSSFPSARTL